MFSLPKHECPRTIFFAILTTIVRNNDAAFDKTKAFVQNGFSDTVSAIDTATHPVIATLLVGHRPWTILASPDDMKLYVCNGGDTTVTVIDIPSLTASASIANVGSGPWDLAFSP
jgi:YVTN family beta-propeller protein